MPLGQVKTSFNYSVEQKRVLNVENVVNDDDNIKQVRPARRAGGGRRGGGGARGVCVGASLAAPPPTPSLAPQDLSIDVYGRKKEDGEEEEEGAAPAADDAAAPAAAAEEDDDMDALLSA